MNVSSKSLTCSMSCWVCGAGQVASSDSTPEATDSMDVYKSQVRSGLRTERQSGMTSESLESVSSSCWDRRVGSQCAEACLSCTGQADPPQAQLEVTGQAVHRVGALHILVSPPPPSPRQEGMTGAVDGSSTQGSTFRRIPFF